MLEPTDPALPMQNATTHEHPPTLQPMTPSPIHKQGKNMSHVKTRGSPVQNRRRKTAVHKSWKKKKTPPENSHQSLSGNESDEERTTEYPALGIMF